MKKLFEFLLDGCWHQYQPHAENIIKHERYKDDQSNVTAQWSSIIYTVRCAKCNKFTSYKVDCK